MCPPEESGGEAPGRKRSRESGVQEEPEAGVDHEEGEEAREVKAPPIPDTPSREQVRLHRLTHRPFRSWCPHCVRGKGREDRHGKSRQKGIDMGIPKIVSDYFFIGRRRPQGKEDRTHAEEEMEWWDF